MSIGRYGECHKELEDEETVIYSYRVEGWGLPDEVRSEVEQVEGMFTIQKSALEEPEIRIERRKISAHRKGFVEKRVPRCPEGLRGEESAPLPGDIGTHRGGRSDR